MNSPHPTFINAEAERAYWRERKHLYVFVRFELPTPVGVYQFHMAVPKDRYDPFAILEMFDKYHGKPTDNAGERGASPDETLRLPSHKSAKQIQDAYRETRKRKGKVATYHVGDLPV